MNDSLRATYRLQFHGGFTFDDATAVVPYLARLGISHLYASPLFRAAPGSTHGYDIYDHNELNPELGSRPDFDRLTSALQAHGMGLIVDFVPNHMGIEGAGNPWWRDVLEHGPASPYARFFDIDWQPLKRELEDKILLPVLAEQYGRVLESDGFRVEFESGNFQLRYGGMTLPLDLRTISPFLRGAADRLPTVCPELESILTAIRHLPARDETAPEKVAERLRERQIIGERLRRLCAENFAVEAALHAWLEEWHAPTDPARFERVDALLSEQVYRLSSWRVAGEEINYRRFFDVNSLAGVRMELPEVFEQTHRLVFELIDAGQLQGLRIDHIDGLAQPAAYLSRLRARCGPDCPIYVEKILGPAESLPSDWPVEGTTGYEAGNALTHLLLQPEGLRALGGLYDRTLGFRFEYGEVAYRSKRLVMQTSMASELNGLGGLLNRLSETHRWYRDFTVNALTTAVRELIACFPVYRTYLDPTAPPAPADVAVIEKALRAARRRNPAMERSTFAFLRDLLLPPADQPHPVDEELRRSFVVRFQQCTGPITAKGVEDTAFYVYNRLAALNEVGGEPDARGLGLVEFHRRNEVQRQAFPFCQLATSTHDTKRSEDVRARLTALTELPDEWGALLEAWPRATGQFRRTIGGESAPDDNEIYLLLQAMLSLWPMPGRPQPEGALERLQQYALKALREAKVNSSWLEPNQEWEEAVQSWLAECHRGLVAGRLGDEFPKLAQRLAELGAVNALAQLVLKLTLPGVPDVYQGCELWDLSLVDPDNRRPVDFTLRADWLTEMAGRPLAEHWRDWTDGGIKLGVMHRLLALRQRVPALFTRGAYEPLLARGRQAERVVAFARRSEAGAAVIVVPRHTAALGFPPLGEVWGETTLELGEGEWTDVLSDAKHPGGERKLADLLAQLPVAVLTTAGL